MIPTEGSGGNITMQFRDVIVFIGFLIMCILLIVQIIRLRKEKAVIQHKNKNQAGFMRIIIIIAIIFVVILSENISDFFGMMIPIMGLIATTLTLYQ